MEPQIINYYNHKKLFCKICNRKGHISANCPNLGVAKIVTEEKGETKYWSALKKKNPEPKKKEEVNGDSISLLNLSESDTDDELLSESELLNLFNSLDSDTDDELNLNFKFNFDEDVKTTIPSPVKVYKSGYLNPDDIDMVVNYTGVERDVAEKIIRENGGDPVTATMNLPLKDSVKNNPSYPYLTENIE